MAEAPTFEFEPATLAVLNIKPGDVLVIHVRRSLQPQREINLRKQVEEQFPGHKCLVLQDGMTLSVASPEEAPNG